jgi:hypothetical protein
VDERSPDEPKANDDKEPVGYKRPPKAHQFRKGRSGNPRGRRKGSKNFETLVREALAKRIQIRSDGKLMTVSVGEAQLMRTLRDAIGGSRRAADQGLRMMERYGLYEDNEDAEADLSLLEDNELRELDRLMYKCRGREDEWHAHQAQPESLTSTDEGRIVSRADRCESHVIEDQ